MTRPVCAVESCPAFASPGSPTCQCHRFAKLLQAIAKGRTCAKCGRVLHAGDWVTVDSGAGHFEHAECPKPAPRTPKRDRAATPLFD